MTLSPHVGAAVVPRRYNVADFSLTRGDITTSGVPSTYQVRAKRIDGEAECVQTITVNVVNVKVRSVSYSGANHTIRRDDPGNAPFNAPHWLDDDLDGNATGPDDRRYPIAYTRDTPVTASVTLAVNGPVPPTIRVRTLGQDHVRFDGTPGAAMTAAGPLPNIVASTTYGLSWQVSFHSNAANVEASWTSIGSTSSPMYVTMVDPLASPLYHTVLHIACQSLSGLGGPIPEHTLVDAVFNRSRSLAMFRASDQAPLTYWAPTGPPGQNLESFLSHPSGNGACGAWAELFTSTLKMHGVITAEVIEIRPQWHAEVGMLNNGLLV